MRGIVVWDLVDVIVLDSHQDIEHELDPKRFIIKKSESLFEREEKKEREREREKDRKRKERSGGERHGIHLEFISPPLCCSAALFLILRIRSFMAAGSSLRRPNPELRRPVRISSMSFGLNESAILFSRSNISPEETILK